MRTMLTLCLFFLFLAVVALFTLRVASISYGVDISGPVTKSSRVTLTDNTSLTANPNVPVAQPGTLTTRTTNSTGTLTMTNAGHGLSTGQRVDLFWVGGSCYGVVLGTVAGLTVPIASVSGGAVLPAQGFAIVVGIATSVPFNCVGNNLAFLATSTGQEGYFVFNDGAADLYAAHLPAGFIDAWKTGDVRANPLAGATPTKVFMSHANVNNQATDMTAVALTH